MYVINLLKHLWLNKKFENLKFRLNEKLTGKIRIWEITRNLGSPKYVNSCITSERLLWMIMEGHSF